jgi:hypothetical protein
MHENIRAYRRRIKLIALPCSLSSKIPVKCSFMAQSFLFKFICRHSCCVLLPPPFHRLLISYVTPLCSNRIRILEEALNNGSQKSHLLLMSSPKKHCMQLCKPLFHFLRTVWRALGLHVELRSYKNEFPGVLVVL